jgi:hypothetical protein
VKQEPRKDRALVSPHPLLALARLCRAAGGRV